MTDIVVAALYKFTPLPDYVERQPALLGALKNAGVMGTVLLAAEGVNGTIAGTRSGIDAALAALRALPGCTDLDHKESHAESMPFYRLKVRLKKEIVSMGVVEADPNKAVGTYVDPQDWNALISDPDTIVIDTRNDYEVGIGTFERAVNPETPTFRDFPDWFRQNREKIEGKRVAMFCTGGIRCEKATSLLRIEGIDNVHHLKGGILKYLETVPENESLWHGECFVFDQRVSVGHGLELGSYDQCHACRRPITEEQKQSPKYVEGVSCEFCYDESSDEQKNRYLERQNQVELAEKRGQAHIGAAYEKSAKKAG